MTRSWSRNQLPLCPASSVSEVRSLKGQGGTYRESSSCHCSASIPGQTTRATSSRSPRTCNSFMSSPVIMVLPAPGSSAGGPRKRLARQHLLVDGGDLVWQRFHKGRGHRQQGIKEVGQPNALCLGDEAEQMAVSIKAPRAALLHYFEARFVVAI